MKFRYTIVFVLLLSFSFGVKAQTAKEKKVEELIQVMGTEKLMNDTFANMISYYKGAYSNVPNEFWDRILTKFDNKELVRLMIPIYSKHFSEEELTGLVSFYKSPVGQKLVEKLPLVMKDSMEAGKIWGEGLGNRIIQELENEKYLQSPPPPKN